jgi:hypothetical protein
MICMGIDLHICLEIGRFIKGSAILASMVKLQFDSKQYKVTLPKAIIEAKGWAKGNELKVLINEKGEIILIKNG